ncbi:hypothetical protein AB0395_43965 [Streptosporangium sp. NPDC051023]|uniref:hypothetical protein n=1 Tax=Streptosporangium sp. NPDC051023 TaxID=3155410 RepID=UPI003450E005
MNEAPEVPADVVEDVDGVSATPTESLALAPVAPTAPEPEVTERPEGIPAAHLAAGGLSGSAVVLGTIYQMLGLPGLIGGTVLAGSGTVAYLRHRYQKNTPRQRRQASESRSSRASHPGRRIGPGLTGALFSGGRSSGRSGGRASGRAGGQPGGSAGRGARRSLLGKGGRSGGLLSGLGVGRGGGAARSGGKTKATKTPKAPKDTAGRRAAQKAGAASRAAGRAFGHRARQLGDGAAQQTRRAAAWANKATKGTAGRAFGHAGRLARTGGRAVARQAKKAGAWVDRRSGRRYSAAWKAMREAKGFRAARRRGAAVLGGWDAQLTAGVMALLAWIVGRYKARKAARTAETTEPTTETTAETESSAPDTTAEAESPDVVHGGEGELPITATVTCPRCQAKHTITVARVGDERIVECPCGYRIHFTRHPAPGKTTTPPTDPAEATTGPAPTTSTTSHTFRRTAMSNNPLAAATAELNGAAAGHAPEDMWTVARELDQLPEIPANVALALRTYTMRLQSGEYPIDPAVGEAMHTLYAQMANLVGVAEEVVTVFRTVHAPDLARGEAPRTNEQMWDVGRQ